MRDIFSKRFFVTSGVIALVYFVINVYLINYRLIFQTLFGQYPIIYKLKLLGALLEGVEATNSLVGTILLIAISLFTGVNIYLLTKRILYIRHLRKLSEEEETVEKIGFLTWLGSILGLIGGGCASCSLPALALIGVSGSFAYLPFKGLEISFLALGFLVLSFVVMIRSELTKNACKIDKG